MRTPVRRDVVVIGGSAGSHDAVQRVIAGLPADLPATVLIALHLAPTAPSTLARMVTRAGRLPARSAVDGQRALPGHVYTAVADRHLLITEHDVLRLSRSPRQNRARPAVDALFRSAARWCGVRAIGVVLSGSLDDGTAGLATIVERGGAALVQQPTDARFGSMPTAALKAVPHATALPATQLGRAIVALVGQPADAADTPPDDNLLWETQMLTDGHSAIDEPGQPVALGCPDCTGGMYRSSTGHAVHYACHVGHSFSPQTLLAARDESVETALWTAISALQEKAMVLEQLAREAASRGEARDHSHYHDEATRAADAGELLRRQLKRLTTGADGSDSVSGMDG